MTGPPPFPDRTGSAAVGTPGGSMPAPPPAPAPAPTAAPTGSGGPTRQPLSRRCGWAALVVYAGAGLTVAAPPSTPWALLVLGGLAALGVGMRTGRVALVGAAVVLAVGARLGRAAVLGHDGPGGGWGGLALALALAAAVELARLAVDAGARRGPVRIAADVRRRLLIDAAVLAGLATAGAGTVLLLASPRWGRPPAALLPLGVVALPALLALLTGLACRGGGPPLGRPPGPAERARAGKVVDVGAHGPARAARRRRPGPVALVVVLAVVVLPLLAGLAARTRGPFGDGEPAPSQTVETVDPSATTVVAAPRPGNPEATREGRDPPSPPLGLVVGAGVAALLLALLLGGGEGLVSADDRRPDTAAAEEPLRGAPAAPVVQALPPLTAAAIVDDALGYLRAELEPRLAVRCAYAAVAGGLGRHEAARQPAETELEFLARQLRQSSTAAGAPAGRGADPVGTGGDPARVGPLVRLTELFELARFSDRPIDPAMRTEALAALEEIRRNLPTAAPSARTAGPHAHNTAAGGRPSDPGASKVSRP